MPSFIKILGWILGTVTTTERRKFCDAIVRYMARETEKVLSED
ncbi:MAG: hypothetical protein ACYST3_05470 [Planctomycetota bacterium]